jgi:hypothetical protein
MPTELHVLLSTPQLPTLARWQSALDSLILPVTLDPAFSPQSPAGSLACTLSGQRTTFEFHLTPSPDLTRTYPGLKGMFPTRDLAATFRFGADPTESACALAAIAALAHAADGVCFNPSEGECSHPDSLLSQARAALPRAVTP